LRHWSGSDWSCRLRRKTRPSVGQIREFCFEDAFSRRRGRKWPFSSESERPRLGSNILRRTAAHAETLAGLLCFSRRTLSELQLWSGGSHLANNHVWRVFLKRFRKKLRMAFASNVSAKRRSFNALSKKLASQFFAKLGIGLRRSVHHDIVKVRDESSSAAWNLYLPVVFGFAQGFKKASNIFARQGQWVA
jgi:hypothetical protein